MKSMQKRTSIFLALLLATVLGHAQSIKRYEYWMDSDYGTHTMVGTTQTDIALKIDISKYGEGVHYLCFRAQDDQQEWGALSRLFFFISETQSTATKRYQYWIDDNYSSQQMVATSGEAVNLKVDLSNMTSGVHYLNLRPQNAEGTWGRLSRWLFFVPDMTYATPTHLEYWLDDDYSSRQLKALNGDTFMGFVDISQLSEGIHFFNYRGLDSEGRWGNIYRHLIFVTGEPTPGEAPLIGYRYAFNGESTYVDLKETTEYELQSFALTIPELQQIGSLTEGCTYDFDAQTEKVSFHRTNNVSFAIQFQDKMHQWTTPATTQFEMKDSCEKAMLHLVPDQELSVSKVAPGDFQALLIDVAQSGTYYLYAEQQATLRIFNTDGSLFTTIEPEQWLGQTHQLPISRGTYFGIVYNMAQEDMGLPLKLRLMTNDNILPTPVINFTDGMVTMSCQVTDADIYYTLDGSEPSLQSSHYSAPFALKRNATIKAKAVHSGWSDSSIATLIVDSYKVTTPVITGKTTRRDGILVYQLEMSCEPAEATIYYTLDGSDPSVYGHEYKEQEPVTITGLCTAKAVGRLNGYNDSDVAEQTFDPTQFRTATPVLTRQGTGISISCQSEGADFYYTTDGTVPTAKSQRVQGSFIQPDRNYRYTVVAILEGSLPSDAATIDVDWLQTPAPRLLPSGESLLAMECDLADATIYYELGGGNPTTASTSVKPGAIITLVDNRVVKAMAIAPNLNASDVVTFTPGGFTAEMVQCSYDGRKLTLTCSTQGAVIHYKFVEGITGEGIYTAPLVVDYPSKVMTYAEKKDWNSSAQTLFSMHSCYDGQTARTDEQGTLSQAFIWCGVDNVKSLVIDGMINSDDLSFLRTMPALHHLDLASASLGDNEALPDGAFADMKQLLSISVPRHMNNAGTGLFRNCQQLAAITWNASFRLTDAMLSGFQNPNLLLYVKMSTDAPTSVRNVIVNGVAPLITLSDADGNANFYCPTPFVAQHISYEHDYLMRTIISQCRGWETIALPFTVQRVSHKTKGALAPFAAHDDTKKPFWLCQLTRNGFEAVDRMEANTPYIISMPNNSVYADDYILGGKVTFEADNVELSGEMPQTNPSKDEFTFVPTFIATAKTEHVLPINRGQEFDGRAEGSAFFRDLEREVRPFEAYISTPEGSYARQLDISDMQTSGILELPMLKANEQDVYYDLQGRRQGTRRNTLGKGVYIIGGKKVLVGF